MKSMVLNLWRFPALSLKKMVLEGDIGSHQGPGIHAVLSPPSATLFSALRWSVHKENTR